MAVELKKNQIIELEITDIGVNGEGIGKYEGCTFFVKDAVIGDSVKAVITLMKKGYGFAKMLEVLNASSCRIDAPCPNARRCGGCQIMEMSYEEQLRFKEQKVRNNLEKIGGFKGIEVLPIIGMDAKEVVPIRYRNKMQFPIGRDKEGNIVAGFFAGRTHSIINAEDCLVAPEVSNLILHTVKSFIEDHKISVYNEKTGQGLIRHLVLRTGYRTGEIMVCLVLNGGSLNENIYTKNVDIDAAFVDKLVNLPQEEMGLTEDGQPYKITSICINTNRENTNVILGREVRCLYGQPFIYDEICMNAGELRGNDKKLGSLKFKISPLSFYQVNSVQMEKLYATALDFADLSGNETVWDLYCGTGTISLFLAQRAGQVKGVEIVPDAIRDAKENAKLNGITNAEFFCGKSEEVFPQYIRMQQEALSEDEELAAGAGSQTDTSNQTVVVLDPPRKGCDRILLDTLLETEPDRIVYVSCDSATLARDLKILSEKYDIKKVQPVDMFPNSVHVESCVLLERVSNRKADSYVKLNVKMEDYYRIKDSKGGEDNG